MVDYGRRRPHNREVDPAVIVSVAAFMRGIRKHLSGDPAPWDADAPHAIENFLAGEPIRLPDGRIRQLPRGQAIDNIIRAHAMNAASLPPDRVALAQIEVDLLADQYRREDNGQR